MAENHSSERVSQQSNPVQLKRSSDGFTSAAEKLRNENVSPSCEITHSRQSK